MIKLVTPVFLGLLALAVFIGFDPDNSAMSTGQVEIDPDLEITNVDRIHKASDGQFYVGARQGLFRLEGDQLVSLSNDDSAERALFFDADGTTYVSMKSGLFAIAGHGLDATSVDTNAPRLFRVRYLDSGEVFFSSQQGLLTWVDDKLVPYGGEDGLGIRQIYYGPTKNWFYASGRTGSFRVTNDGLQRIDTGRIRDADGLVQLEDELLVMAGPSLFRIRDEKFELAVRDSDIGRIYRYAIVPGKGVFFGAAGGFYKYEIDGFRQLEATSKIGDIMQFYQSSAGQLFVATAGGFWVLEDTRLRLLEADEPAAHPLLGPGGYYAFEFTEMTDGTVLVGTGEAAYLYQRSILHRIEGESDTGSVQSIVEMQPGVALAGGSKGLFRIEVSSGWNARLSGFAKKMWQEISSFIDM